MSRMDQLQSWLQGHLPSFELEPLGGDASFRRYLRVRSNGQLYMLMDAPPELEPVADFVRIDEFLAAFDVRVPRIIAKDEAQGFLLLEDFGNTLFFDALSPDSAEALYKQALDQLIHMQSIDVAPLELPKYDAVRLINECALFTEWFLPHLGVEKTKEFDRLWEQVLGSLTQNMLAQPQVFVHRDYHCRNLMYLEAEDNLGIIDFQDAVVGAATYDVVSLLKDAYVSWGDELLHVLFTYAWQKQQRMGLPVAQRFEAYQIDASASAVQRALKVLGIFVRLSKRDGKHGYLKDLPQVYANFTEQLTVFGLSEFKDWIDKEVTPKFISSIKE